MGFNFFGKGKQQKKLTAMMFTFQKVVPTD
jgi:hypothetical protein